MKLPLEAHLPADFPAERPPRSAAMRRAMARAATRRGCRRMTGPSATSAGGTRVVLPAPGRRRDHDRPPLAKAPNDLLEVRIDGQGLESHDG